MFRLGISPVLPVADRSASTRSARCGCRRFPRAAEARIRPGELRDPLGEDPHRPVAAIVHKYPDRVLFLALDSCSIYCRHCTRRRITKGGEAVLGREALGRGRSTYLRAHPEVRDVLVSGGDPLAPRRRRGWTSCSASSARFRTWR